MSASNLPVNMNLSIDYSNKPLNEIWLAGGCFWGVDAYMRRVSGVAVTSVGYANGNTENPTYEQVCHQGTGHAETVYIKYDPDRISLDSLLQEFFFIIDPTTRNHQGGDIGTQYRSAIYYKNPEDLEIIQNAIKKEQMKYKKPIIIEVKLIEKYYLAEEYHQSYLEKNPNGYCHIKF